MSKKFIIANWKNKPETLAQAETLMSALDEYFQGQSETKQHSLVICPPFLFLEDVARLIQQSHLAHNAELGAQDVALEIQGAATGETTGVMLQKVDVRYVIIGHSERRWKLGESEETVNLKLKAALIQDFVPVVCIGEKLRDGSEREFLSEQIKKTFVGVSKDHIRRCLVAYEPVWAISTNLDAKPDTPESAAQSVKIIRGVLQEEFQLSDADMPLFLYGGSVKAHNVKSFLEQPEFSGVLVGGASVDAEEFIKILSLVV